MARRIDRIARALGAEIIGTLPDAGGGAFGAARIPRLISDLKQRMKPGVGRRPGRPTNSKWVYRPKVPMSRDTARKLREIAQSASSPERKVSPMQVAAHILEQALKNGGED